MAYVNTGEKRARKIFVTKTVDNVPVSGYEAPGKQYPTPADFVNGYFTYNAVNYTIPDDTTLARWSDSDYFTLYMGPLQSYVTSIENVSFSGTNYQVADPTACPPGNEELTTTTEGLTTTTGEAIYYYLVLIFTCETCTWESYAYYYSTVPRTISHFYTRFDGLTYQVIDEAPPSGTPLDMSDMVEYGVDCAEVPCNDPEATTTTVP